MTGSERVPESFGEWVEYLADGVRTALLEGYGFELEEAVGIGRGEMRGFVAEEMEEAGSYGPTVPVGFRAALLARVSERVGELLRMEQEAWEREARAPEAVS